ncbi:sensor histidine kinase [Beijerinckia mobilis]|uniref:sensor histidine kinase n=1 Tax=Beijerinckia mobilis TaxID=231434 RepID=UPI00054EB31D|nr:sensor histidine kinase KdpD [Beijerinckia mobilis]
MTEHERPDPDRLLELVRADRSVSGRGRLKIFFGAAAGVGKTFSMLNEARRLYFDEGRDVVIGIIEHHGRAETAALAEGLPAIPLAEIDHRGVKLKEFDLDAALKRKPSLILMDELAHTNAPGTQHSKRWLDVETLLDNGIDVYSTLNVQHLESVNDVVARLTGVWVQETVPDSIFDDADEVALVDIPSDDLLQRLAAGKVYVGEGANRRAAEHFFKKANLTALRELALRRTADRVDAEGDELSAVSGSRGALVATKILVLTGADLHSARLIRHARRMAVSAKAPWTVLYLHTHRHEALGEKARLRLDKHLRLAEKLGATVTRLPSADPAETALAYARKYGFTRIIVGYDRPRLRLLQWRKSLSQQLIEGGAGTEVVTIGEEAAEQGSAQEPDDDAGHREPVLRYLWAVAIIAGFTLIGLPFRGLTDANDISMVYLVGVVLAAARLGIGPALLASFLSVAAFNFFFTQPYYTFQFYDNHYYFTFAFMFVTSLIVGSMTARLHGHARQARKSEEDTLILYGLTRGLSSVRGVDGICEVAIGRLSGPYGISVSLHIRAGGQLRSYPAGEETNDVKEMGVVQWVAENARMAGRHTDTMPSARGLYLPLRAEDEILGVIGFTPDDADHQFSGAEIMRFETFADLIASALQRAIRTEEAEKSRVEVESERLRNILLASVSHDLRTPLTVMNGSVANLLRMRKKLPREAIEELTGLWGQLTRLQKFVGNLLKMAAITSGRLKLNFQPYLIQEIIGSAMSEVEPQREGRQINASTTGTIPLIMMDGALIEQVLVNLIENAIAHTAPGGTITVHAEKDADVLRVRVSDNGTGIREGEEERIFDKFHREASGKPDQHEGAGAGLGLAICRGIVGAHGGIIYAKNNPASKSGGPAGASVIFTLPLTKGDSHE